MISRDHSFSIFVIVFLSLAFLLLSSCEHTPEIAPEPLTGFSEKVTALVTTTVRGELRDNLLKQQLLMAQLPSFVKTLTMNQLMDELKKVDPLRDLAYFIETDILFELQKPEYQRENLSFNAPEIQAEIVSAIIAGMKKALDQIKGGKDTQ